MPVVILRSGKNRGEPVSKPHEHEWIVLATSTNTDQPIDTERCRCGAWREVIQDG